jgi:hypothetical protein
VTTLLSLQVLLVSDPTTDKAAAGMDVLVGHFQDPEEFPGLAHFCGTLPLATLQSPEPVDDLCSIGVTVPRAHAVLGHGQAPGRECLLELPLVSRRLLERLYVDRGELPLQPLRVAPGI